MPVASVALVAEVADTSLAIDLGRKAAIYAAAGVAEYWVVDLGARLIHQHWSPQGDTYGRREEMAFGGRIEAATISGLQVDLAEL